MPARTGQIRWLAGSNLQPRLLGQGKQANKHKQLGIKQAKASLPRLAHSHMRACACLCLCPLRCAPPSFPPSSLSHVLLNSTTPFRTVQYTIYPTLSCFLYFTLRCSLVDDLPCPPQLSCIPPSLRSTKSAVILRGASAPTSRWSRAHSDSRGASPASCRQHLPTPAPEAPGIVLAAAVETP